MKAKQIKVIWWQNRPVLHSVNAICQSGLRWRWQRYLYSIMYAADYRDICPPCCWFNRPEEWLNSVVGRIFPSLTFLTSLTVFQPKTGHENMRLIVRTSILFGPHFPRPINDDSARSADCFCWLVRSFPEIFSLQLARGEARKSSRNLAPRSLSFCTPGSFVHNRYCLCELKLFVLRWEKGGVRNSRRGFKCVTCSLLMTYPWHLSHCNKPHSCLCSRSILKQFTVNYHLLRSTLHSSVSFPNCTEKKKKLEGVGSSGNIWLNINYWHSCSFFFFFFFFGN